MGFLRSHWARLLFVMLTAFSLSQAASAQGPEGDFVCRRYQFSGGEDGAWTLTNVAIMQLHKDGSYGAKDLTVAMPEAHGHFTYEDKSRLIEWDSGIWKALLGHYFPRVAGTDVIMVTTKADPDGKINGALQCVRYSGAIGNKQ